MNITYNTLVTVKPLAWMHKKSEGVYEYWEAHNRFASYEVGYWIEWEEGDPVECGSLYWSYAIGERDEGHFTDIETIEEGKRKAEAHWLSVLEPFLEELPENTIMM